MKCVLVTDNHLGLYKASELYHEINIKLFKTITDICARNNIDTIIHLGDWFHNRKYINLKTISYAYQIAEILKNFNVYIIAGNHDIFYKNSIDPTSLDIYNEFDNIHVIKKPHIIDDITLLPWGQYTTDNIDKINTPRLFSHLEVNEFLMNANHKFTGGMSPDLFKKFNQVLLGHFHTPSKMNNIEYIGAPFQMNFGDIGKRGFYIFDGGDLKFIEFTDAPKYVKIMSETEINSDEIRGNIVRLIYENDYGKTENNNLLEHVKSCGPLQLYTDFSNISKTIDVNVDSDVVKPKENIALLHDYINIIDIPDNINVKTLQKMINNLTEGIV